MWRTVLGAFVGLLLGLGLTVLILRVAYSAIAAVTHPKIYEIEYNSIYQTLILGAGFGAVCGALAGFARAVLREWARGRPGA